MQYLLILLLPLLTILNANNFTVTIDKQFDSALFDITQDYDRQITAVGFSKNFKTSNSRTRSYNNPFEYLKGVSNSNGTHMHLIKIDNTATITLNKVFNLAKCSKAISVIKTPANGYFVGGYTEDGFLTIVKLDSQSRILFTRIFGTKNRNIMNSLIKLRDGGVLSIGASKTTRTFTGDIFESGLGLNDTYLTRFSKDGQQIWSKKFGTAYDDEGIDAVEARDGSIIVISKTSYNDKQDMTIMRITQNGNKIWTKHYKSDDIITAHKIIELKDGNFLLSLSQKARLQKEYMRLIKFDIQNNIINDKVLNTTYSSALKDIKEYSNSNIIGVGYIKDNYNTDALVVILNSKLEMLYQRHYGDENFDEFNAVTILHNSQSAVAGIKTDKNSQESNMWITKINEDASMSKKYIPIIEKKHLNIKHLKKIVQSKYNTQKTNSLYAELIDIFKNEIDTKKILIKEDLNIELIDKDLYYGVGVYLLNKKQKIFLNDFYKKLIPFLNLHKSSINTLEINGHTSSEWGDKNFADSYLNNAELSMKRAFEVTKHMFKSQDKPTKIILSEILKGGAYSSSKKSMIDGIENKEKSRKITFLIELELL